MTSIGVFGKELLESGHWEDLGCLEVRGAGAGAGPVGARYLFHSCSVRAIRKVENRWAIGGVYSARLFCLSLFGN
jgi:hypothetical protein